MNARMGDNRFSVFAFPGKRKDVEKLLDWTPNLEVLTKIFSKLIREGSHQRDQQYGKHFLISIKNVH